MSFQTPITIRQALNKIERHDYALPAIQREFVWSPEKICSLFDSLMRGYPIGSFLFWTVDALNSREFKFYDFVREYHAKENPHCPQLDVMEPRSLTAVLDGQQRLTAFNIALRGSMATKQPRKWRNNPDAYPRTTLYLDLLREADDNEAGLKHDFRFLTKTRASESREHLWFPVRKILDFSNAGPAINAYLNEHNVADNELAFQSLYNLYQVVNERGTISYFLEEEQDLDKVLNIFIRVNSGAEPLSYSDLLMSIATAQWGKLDARDAVYALVDDLNETRAGFELSKDFVLKAGLMLSDIASVGFKVTNFNAKNMATLERNWDRISDALRLTIRLVADYGFSRDTLGADSAILPIAYYVYQRGLDESFLTHQSGQLDREAIRGWLIRSLLKSGVWGSGLDTTLTALRGVLQKNQQVRFPVDEIESEMARRGRVLRFTDEEIEDLSEVRYGDRRCFALLSLLFPFVDLRNDFHVDHFFPKSLFRKGSIQKAGIDIDRLPELKLKCDSLPNLQLLQGSINQGKSAKLPADWLDKEFRIPKAKQEYCERHDLGDVPASISDFEKFYDSRRNRLMNRIKSLIGSGDSQNREVE